MPKREAVSRDCRHASVEGSAVYQCCEFHEPSSYFGRVIREKRNAVWPYWWNAWTKYGWKTVLVYAPDRQKHYDGVE